MVTVIKKDNRARHRGGSRFECFLAGGKISIFDSRGRRKGRHTAGPQGEEEDLLDLSKMQVAMLQYTREFPGDGNCGTLYQHQNPAYRI